MKKLFVSTVGLLSLLTASAVAQNTKPRIPIVHGVSIALATERSKILSEIQYKLHFTIPSEKTARILAKENLSFSLSEIPAVLQLDFKQEQKMVKSVILNGKNIVPQISSEHILLDKENLLKGKNQLDIEFTAGDESLNRNPDYLYALFVPDRARLAFPCFDQPDLKARFMLSLTVPKDWKVLANGADLESIANPSANTFEFKNSDKLPTYLFSFTAGRYTSVKRKIGKFPMEFLHRETDSNKVRLSVDSVFIAHHDAIRFLEEWTNIGFPFQKVGFVAIPDFQFGGMEHPGEVQYKASSLFLDEGATKDQFISRSNLISHETAHMWFGDLVTMKWFNDVWMKEVFANFMADKVTEKLMGTSTFDLKFLQDHYPAAYGIDRTRGANPIRQQLDNLQEAGSMYGNIIYHKAPIMMRQLEQLMGEENFQNGIREYLKTYAYGNATWNDLISILNKFSSTDLLAWNRVWVNQPGRPVFQYKIIYNGNKIKQFRITQQAESGDDRVWPQAFKIKAFYSNASKDVTVNMKGKSVDMDQFIGMEKPEFILFNSDGKGYGIFPFQQISMDSIIKRGNALERASAYINAYENVLSENSLTPLALLRLYSKGLMVEENEMNLRLLTGYISNLYWTFLSKDERDKYNPLLEAQLWEAMTKQVLPNHKKVLFTAYQNVYLSQAATANIHKIWKSKSAPSGVKLTEDDFTAMALSLALRSDTVNSVLQEQLERISNAERKAKLLFMMPALSATVEDRDAFYSSLAQIGNRQKEAWVTESLSYLHHPLRQRTSSRYLKSSLDLLSEIQATGDIFFPQSWLSAIFGRYQSRDAYQVVDDFLKTHQNYNPKLRDKILQATDNLFKASSRLK